MLMMMRYRFAGGSSGRQAYERFSKWTPAAGLRDQGRLDFSEQRRGISAA